MNMYMGNKLQSNGAKLGKIALCTILSVFLCIIMSACRSHDLTKIKFKSLKLNSVQKIAMNILLFQESRLTVH